MFVNDLKPGMFIRYADFQNAMIISVCNVDKFLYDVYLLLGNGKLHKCKNFNSTVDYKTTFRLM